MEISLVEHCVMCSIFILTAIVKQSIKVHGPLVYKSPLISYWKRHCHSSGYSISRVSMIPCFLHVTPFPNFFETCTAKHVCVESISEDKLSLRWYFVICRKVPETPGFMRKNTMTSLDLTGLDFKALKWVFLLEGSALYTPRSLWFQ